MQQLQVEMGLWSQKGSESLEKLHLGPLQYSWGKQDTEGFAPSSRGFAWYCG